MSDDAVTWVQAAAREDFATDAVSEGHAGFGRVFAQGDYAVTVATVGHKSAIAWCYQDPADCRTEKRTVLVSPNGRDWRRLPLPGEQPQPDHPVEAHGFPVNGRLAVVHTVGSEAVLSILESVKNAVPINNGEKPDLPFKIVGPGDEIEPALEYGYAIYTHCGLPAIGPLNGVHCVGVGGFLVEELFEVVPDWGGNVFGFIVLTADDEIEYRVDGQLIVRYLPDPDHKRVLCA